MTPESGSPRGAAVGRDAKRKNAAKTRDVNAPLRRAYESVVDETIPQSLLDLLNKLD